MNTLKKTCVILLILFAFCSNVYAIDYGDWDKYSVDNYKNEADIGNFSTLLYSLGQGYKNVVNSNDKTKMQKYKECLAAAASNEIWQDPFVDQAQKDALTSSWNGTEASKQLGSITKASNVFEQKIKTGNTTSNDDVLNQDIPQGDGTAFAKELASYNIKDKTIAKKWLTQVLAFKNTASYDALAIEDKKSIENSIRSCYENNFLTKNQVSEVKASYGDGFFNTDSAGNTKKEIYYNPKQLPSADTSQESLEDMMSDAQAFVDTPPKQIPISSSSLQDFSGIMYNLLLTIGVVTSVIIGLVIGIKFLLSSVEGKASVKQLLVPYLVGCLIVFGGFGMWKLVVTILQTIK